MLRLGKNTTRCTDILLQYLDQVQETCPPVLVAAARHIVLLSRHLSEIVLHTLAIHGGNGLCLEYLHMAHAEWDDRRATVCQVCFRGMTVVWR